MELCHVHKYSLSIWRSLFIDPAAVWCYSYKPRIKTSKDSCKQLVSSPCQNSLLLLPVSLVNLTGYFLHCGKNHHRAFRHFSVEEVQNVK